MTACTCNPFSTDSVHGPNAMAVNSQCPQHGDRRQTLIVFVCGLCGCNLPAVGIYCVACANDIASAEEGRPR